MARIVSCAKRPGQTCAATAAELSGEHEEQGRTEHDQCASGYKGRRPHSRFRCQRHDREWLVIPSSATPCGEVSDLMAGTPLVGIGRRQPSYVSQHLFPGSQTTLITRRIQLRAP